MRHIVEMTMPVETGRGQGWEGSHGRTEQDGIIPSRQEQEHVASSTTTAGPCGGTGETCEEYLEEVVGSAECRLRRSVLF